MRFNIVMALIAVLLSAGLDCYILRRIGCGSRGRVTVRRVYIGVMAAAYASVVALFVLPKDGSVSLGALMWMLWVFVTAFCSRLVYFVFDLMGLIPVVFRRRRSRLMSRAGVAAAGAVAVLFAWGAFINRGRVSVVSVEIQAVGLPAAFDGYRIAQISDLHSGTWGSDTSFMSRFVDRVLALDADMIVFTGDIVNNRSQEMEPMVPILMRLHAPDGVYAIMGNHDYGDYAHYPTEALRRADVYHLHRLYAMTPMRLLLNETDYVRRHGDSIAVIGVENISNPPYKTYGNLAEAYPATADSTFKILLSHNPDHWTRDIRDNDSVNIALTLSGHTHAMQMQLGGVSPGDLIYPTNWGLFTDSAGKALYVNRGAGTVGMPMRIGATPEITEITLRAKR